MISNFLNPHVCYLITGNWMRRFVLNLLLRTHRPPSIFWFSKLYTGHHKHLVSKARRSCTWKGKKSIWFAAKQGRYIRIRYCTHCTVFEFVHGSSGRKNLLCTSFLFPSSGERQAARSRTTNFTGSCSLNMYMTSYI